MSSRHNPKSTQHQDVEDPLLALIGVGKAVWAGVNVDNWLDDLRDEDPAELNGRGDDTTPSPDERRQVRMADLEQRVWLRLVATQGETFHTVTGLPVQHRLDGDRIRYHREGANNAAIAATPRRQLGTALTRCPLARTTEIQDLMSFPYLYALLTDERIRGEDW